MTRFNDAIDQMLAESFAQYCESVNQPSNLLLAMPRYAPAYFTMPEVIDHLRHPAAFGRLY